MDNLRKILRNELQNFVNENEKKKEEIIVPQGCFGGPKHGIGAVVSIVELLMR